MRGSPPVDQLVTRFSQQAPKKVPEGTIAQIERVAAVSRLVADRVKMKRLALESLRDHGHEFEESYSGELVNGPSRLNVAENCREFGRPKPMMRNCGMKSTTMNPEAVAASMGIARQATARTGN